LDDHSEFPETVRDRILRIESPPTDPSARALKVAWANDFAWDFVVDVSSQNKAEGEAPADDTATIQKAMDTVAAHGGGVVQLSAGVFRVSQLTLPAGVVLRGKSREDTVVMGWNSLDDIEVPVRRARSDSVNASGR